MGEVKDTKCLSVMGCQIHFSLTPLLTHDLSLHTHTKYMGVQPLFSLSHLVRQWAWGVGGLGENELNQHI